MINNKELQDGLNIVFKDHNTIEKLFKENKIKEKKNEFRKTKLV